MKTTLLLGVISIHLSKKEVSVDDLSKNWLVVGFEG